MAAANEFKTHEFVLASDSLGGTAFGKVHGFTLSINNNVVPSFVAGSRTADNIKEGNQLVGGSMTLALRDKTEVLDLVTASPIADDTLYARLDDDVSGNQTVDITINNVKWNQWDVDIGDDGTTVMETATFLAKTVTVAEVTN